jgi:ABC-type uncharacterized transport system permease subunit
MEHIMTILMSILESIQAYSIPIRCLGRMFSELRILPHTNLVAIHGHSVLCQLPKEKERRLEAGLVTSTSSW